MPPIDDTAIAGSYHNHFRCANRFAEQPFAYGLTGHPIGRQRIRD